MTTALRALVMLGVLVGLPGAWIYYGPLPAGAQQVVDRVVGVAKSTFGRDAAESEKAKPAWSEGSPAPLWSETPGGSSAVVAAAAPAPPNAAPSPAPATNAEPPSFAQRAEPLLARLRQLGATEYAMERWGASGNLFRFQCEMPLGGGHGLTQQFEAVAADPQAALEQVVAEVTRNVAPPVNLVSYQALQSNQPSAANSGVAEPAAEIAATFNQFIDALKRGDGAAAEAVVSGRTADIYEHCRDVALNSSGVNFESLTQMDVLLVLQLRYRLTREQLAALSGRDLLKWGVHERLTKTDSMEGVQTGRVHVDGTTAFAEIVKDGQLAPGAAFRFVHEDGRWKFDLAHLWQVAEPNYDALRRDTGKSKTEVAIFLMERTYGRPIPFEILQGPLDSSTPQVAGNLQASAARF